MENKKFVLGASLHAATLAAWPKSCILIVCFNSTAWSARHNSVDRQQRIETRHIPILLLHIPPLEGGEGSSLVDFCRIYFINRLPCYDFLVLHFARTQIQGIDGVASRHPGARTTAGRVVLQRLPMLLQCLFSNY
jgi:hypothetical protein